MGPDGVQYESITNAQMEIIPYEDDEQGCVWGKCHQAPHCSQTNWICNLMSQMERCALVERVLVLRCIKLSMQGLMRSGSLQTKRWYVNCCSGKSGKVRCAETNGFLRESTTTN